MRIKALWECSDQDQEVGAKHIDDTEQFHAASHEPIPPLAGEPGTELIDLDDKLIEDPTIAHLSREENNAQLCDDESQEEEENDVDTLIAM